MKILGIDPGLERCGWAVVTEKNKKPTLEAAGCIFTKPQDFACRLLALKQQLSAIVKTHAPDRVAVEELFFAKNAKTALMVGHARGVILATVAEYGIPVVSFTPNQVKLAACGSGAADKRQIQKMIMAIFRLTRPPKPDDAADAVAVALCGLQTKIFQG